MNPPPTVRAAASLPELSPVFQTSPDRTEHGYNLTAPIREPLVNAHVVLRVSNWRASAAWYEGVLGFEREKYDTFSSGRRLGATRQLTRPTTSARQVQEPSIFSCMLSSARVRKLPTMRLSDTFTLRRAPSPPG